MPFACDSDDEEEKDDDTKKGDAEKEGAKEEDAKAEGVKEEGAEEQDATYLLDEVRCAATCTLLALAACFLRHTEASSATLRSCAARWTLVMLLSVPC